MWPVLGSLASSILGGLVVAAISYLAGREKSKAEVRKLEAEAKRTDAETTRILTEIGASSAVYRGSLLAVGWKVTGLRPQDYDVRIDRAVSHSGTSCAFIRAKPAAKAFVAIRQECNAFGYRGSRLRLSAYIKAQDVRHAALWFRVDGRHEEMLAFDNMYGRHVVGTCDWRKCDLVLDVPGNAKMIVFGALLSEQGAMWVDDFCLEKVDDSVPTTDRFDGYPTPQEPINLDFEN